MLICLGIGILYAQEIYTLRTNIKDLKIYTEDKYDVIDLFNADANSEIVGNPNIPIKRVKIVIPENATISDIRIISTEEQEILGEYYIQPTQQPVISSLKNAPPIYINEKVYQTNAFYPSQVLESIDEGLIAGTKIAILNYFPIIYNPVSKKIKAVNVTFQVNLKQTSKEKSMNKSILNSHSYEFLAAYIKSNVINPDAVNQNLNIASKSSIVNQLDLSATQEPKIDYVIITADSLTTGFQKIADWKTKKGLYSKIITTEWIASNFSGSDLQEKIRYFIKYAFQNWGTIWFLIGGDTNIVPVRQAWISHYNHWQLIETKPNGEMIPTDMYYSCLDGTWNGDNDNTFGEGSWNRYDDRTFSNISYNANIDEVDRIPDVFVGRIPIQNNQQLNNYKTKYFRYINGVNITPNKALVFSANSESIYSSEMNTVSSRFSSNVLVDKLYECTSSYNSFCGTKTDVLNALNSNQYHIICGYGHGNITSFEACDASIRKEDILYYTRL